jgi:hypothetical protein
MLFFFKQRLYHRPLHQNGILLHMYLVLRLPSLSPPFVAHSTLYLGDAPPHVELQTNGGIDQCVVLTLATHDPQSG